MKRRRKMLEAEKHPPPPPRQEPERVLPQGRKGKPERVKPLAETLQLRRTENLGHHGDRTVIRESARLRHEVSMQQLVLNGQMIGQISTSAASCGPCVPPRPPVGDEYCGNCTCDGGTAPAMQ